MLIKYTVYFGSVAFFWESSGIAGICDFILRQ